MPDLKSAQTAHWLDTTERTLGSAFGFVEGYLRALGVSFRKPLRAASRRQDGSNFTGPLTFLVISIFLAVTIKSIPINGEPGLFLPWFKHLQSSISSPSPWQLIAQSILGLLFAVSSGWLLAGLARGFVSDDERAKIADGVAYLYGAQVILVSLCTQALSYMPLLVRRLWPNIYIPYLSVVFLVAAVVLSPVLVPFVGLAGELLNLCQHRHFAWRVLSLAGVAVVFYLGLSIFALTLSLTFDEKLDGVLVGLREDGCNLVIRNETERIAVLESSGHLIALRGSNLDSPGEDIGFDIVSDDGGSGPILLEKKAVKVFHLNFNKKFSLDSAHQILLVEIGGLSGAERTWRKRSLELECKPKDGETASCLGLDYSRSQLWNVR